MPCCHELRSLCLLICKTKPRHAQGMILHCRLSPRKRCAVDLQRSILDLRTLDSCKQWSNPSRQLLVPTVGYRIRSNRPRLFTGWSNFTMQQTSAAPCAQVPMEIIKRVPHALPMQGNVKETERKTTWHQLSLPGCKAHLRNPGKAFRPHGECPAQSWTQHARLLFSSFRSMQAPRHPC